MILFAIYFIILDSVKIYTYKTAQGMFNLGFHFLVLVTYVLNYVDTPAFEAGG